ncbi:unnamed protein product [Rhizoctonia solani]|uniref:Transmembrane protein n=1 Tax=Rhizoctonia solani TaxID=456999 RepID=A0A8H3D636_9AGAM|nr:unnamed protein product [Rhizoctonia solani]
MPYNVTIDDISPIITYTGDWTDMSNKAPHKAVTAPFYFDNTFHHSTVPGSTATFRFNGTAFSIYGGKRTTYGDYTVTVDNETSQRFDGYGEPPAGSNVIGKQLLFRRVDLEDTLHEVVFTNAGGSSGRQNIDFDYVTWTSGRDSLLRTSDLDDTHHNWTYTGDWRIRSGLDVYNSSTHLVRTLGSQASLTFEGVGIYLYGHLLNDHGKFNVTIDDAPPVSLNSFASAGFSQIPLYYADGLGPGTHRLTVTNAEEGKVLSIDYARVLQPDDPVTTSPQPPQPPQENNQPTRNHGAIAGIVIGAVAAFILIFALSWYWIGLRRRRQYEPATIWNPRNGLFRPPPMGYAPRSAGPGWAAERTQSGTTPYVGTPGRKMAYM